MVKTITIKKTNKKNFIVVKDKHKILNVIGFLNDNNEIEEIDREKFYFYLKNGTSASNTVLDKIKKYQIKTI